MCIVNFNAGGLWNVPLDRKFSKFCLFSRGWLICSKTAELPARCAISKASRVQSVPKKTTVVIILRLEYLSVWVCKSSQSETKQRTQSDVQLIDWNRKVQKKIFAWLVFCHPTINQGVMTWGGFPLVSRMTLSKDWKEKLLISILANYMCASLKLFYIGQSALSQAHNVGNNGIDANFVLPSVRLHDFIDLFNF